MRQEVIEELRRILAEKERSPDPRVREFVATMRRRYAELRDEPRNH